AVAIRHDTEQLTFLELDAQANRLANLLVSRGLGAEQRVALCLPRTLDLPVAMLAVLKAGGAYVPVDPSYPDAHQRTILEHAGAEWLIVADAATAARFPQQSCLVLHDARPELAAASARAPQVVVQPRQLAYVIFTSGSTGVPKGVAIEHGTVSGFLAW